MTDAQIDTLRQIGATFLAPPLPRQHSIRAEEGNGKAIPADHMAFLLRANGATAYAGYFRIFGVGAAGIDLIDWNANDCWKFAWDGRCDGYLCFAETGWGDQYAYRLSDRVPSEVYLLDALSMTPTRVASSFSEFLDIEFIRCAREPYDVVLKQVEARLGPLEMADHIIYQPSPLIGGDDAPEGVGRVPARAAMIMNGDIAVQLDAAKPNAVLSGVTGWEDEQGRARLQLNWRA